MQSYSPTACHFEIITHPLLLSFPLYVRNLKIKYIAIFRLHTPTFKDTLFCSSTIYIFSEDTLNYLSGKVQKRERGEFQTASSLLKWSP